MVSHCHGPDTDLSDKYWPRRRQVDAMRVEAAEMAIWKASESDAKVHCREAEGTRARTGIPPIRALKRGQIATFTFSRRPPWEPNVSGFHAGFALTLCVSLVGSTAVPRGRAVGLRLPIPYTVRRPNTELYSICHIQ